MIKMYSTHCPQCEVLEKKLIEKNLSYEVCDDINRIMELNFKTVPILEVNGKFLNFSEAIKWVNEQYEY